LIPEGQIRTDFFRQYPFARFGILAEAPPSSDELIYAHSDRFRRSSSTPAAHFRWVRRTVQDLADSLHAPMEPQVDVTASHVTTDAMTPLREDGGD
jgi:hypothetical protein